MSRPGVSLDGRIELAPPSPEALRQAAEDVLGTADEVTLEGAGKVFRGMGGGVFLQPASEAVGEAVEFAPAEIQDALMAEAAKVRAAKAEAEREKYCDPCRNPFIKVHEFRPPEDETRQRIIRDLPDDARAMAEDTIKYAHIFIKDPAKRERAIADARRTIEEIDALGRNGGQRTGR